MAERRDRAQQAAALEAPEGDLADLQRGADLLGGVDEEWDRRRRRGQSRRRRLQLGAKVGHGWRVELRPGSQLEAIPNRSSAANSSRVETSCIARERADGSGGGAVSDRGRQTGNAAAAFLDPRQFTPYAFSKRPERIPARRRNAAGALVSSQAILNSAQRRLRFSQRRKRRGRSRYDENQQLLLASYDYGNTSEWLAMRSAPSARGSALFSAV